MNTQHLLLWRSILDPTDSKYLLQPSQLRMAQAITNSIFLEFVVVNKRSRYHENTSIIFFKLARLWVILQDLMDLDITYTNVINILFSVWNTENNRFLKVPLVGNVEFSLKLGVFTRFVSSWYLAVLFCEVQN